MESLNHLWVEREYLEWCCENSSVAAFVWFGENLQMCESTSREQANMVVWQVYIQAIMYIFLIVLDIHTIS